MSDDYPQNVEDFPRKDFGGIRPREIQTGFAAARVSQALKACAQHAADRGVWIAERADELGIPEKTFAGYVYGANAPNLDNFAKLVAHFGSNFTSEFIAPFEQIAQPARDVAAIQKAGSVTQLRALAKTMRAVVDDLDKAVGE